MALGHRRQHQFTGVRGQRPRVPETRGPSFGGCSRGPAVDDARQGLPPGERVPPGRARLELRRRRDRPTGEGVRVRAVPELLDGRLVAHLRPAGRGRPAHARRPARREARVLDRQRRRHDRLPQDRERLRVRFLPAHRSRRLVGQCDPTGDASTQRGPLAQGNGWICRGPRDGADRHEAGGQHRGSDARHPLRLRRTGRAPGLRDPARRRHVLAVAELSAVCAALHVLRRLPELQGAPRPKDFHVQPVWPR